MTTWGVVVGAGVCPILSARVRQDCGRLDWIGMFLVEVVEVACYCWSARDE